jgi:hypothetical protein
MNDLSNQYSALGFNPGYYDLLILDRVNSTEPGFEYNFGSIDTDFLLSVENLNFSFAQEAINYKRLAGEGADPNNFGLSKSDFSASFNMLLKASSTGYIDMGFACLWDAATLAYQGTGNALVGKILSTNSTVGIGTTFGPQTSLSATDNYNVRTLGVGITAPTNLGKDTVANVSERSGSVIIPMYIKGGLFFQQVGKWGVGVDLAYNNWSNYLGMGIRDSLKNMTSLNVGGFYTPNPNAIKSYFKRVEYRAGMRYDNGMLSANETNVSTLAFSLGAGLPLGKTRSKVNLAAEYMMRGTTEQKLVREEYIRFVIGVSISDKWFYRYRYD